MVQTLQKGDQNNHDKMKIPKITIKQEAFCNRYIETGNACEAYKMSYNSQRMKNSTVNRKAQELLANGIITARIKELQEEVKQKSVITKDRILNELGAILDANIKDYVYFDGSSLAFKSFDDLTEKQLKAIESIKQGKNGIELKLHGKSWTIERICKMLGYDKPTVLDIRNALVEIDTGMDN